MELQFFVFLFCFLNDGSERHISSNLKRFCHKNKLQTSSVLIWSTLNVSKLTFSISNAFQVIVSGHSIQVVALNSLLTSFKKIIYVLIFGKPPKERVL